MYRRCVRISIINMAWIAAAICRSRPMATRILTDGDKGKSTGSDLGSRVADLARVTGRDQGGIPDQARQSENLCGQRGGAYRTLSSISSRTKRMAEWAAQPRSAVRRHHQFRHKFVADR